MFNFYGDLNWRHNFAGLPQLSLITGIFFLAAVFWTIFQLVRLSKVDQPYRLIKIGGFLFIFVWLFSLLLPSALTIEGIPHALRSIGVIPAAYLFAGLGACLVYEWGKNKLGEKKIKGLFIDLLFAMILSSFILYFILWAKHPQLEDAFTKRFIDVGKELNALPPEAGKYVIKNEGDLPTEVPKFIQRTAGRKEAVYIEPWETEIIDFLPGDFVFIMNKELHFLEPLINRFPQGFLHQKERILIYEIK